MGRGERASTSEPDARKVALLLRLRIRGSSYDPKVAILCGLHTLGTVLIVPTRKPTRRTDRIEHRGKAKWDRRPAVIREQFSVRLTLGQIHAIERTRGESTVSARVRELMRVSLDAKVWPEFLDGTTDEDASEWLQVRISPDLRVEIYEYQQAVGCRDLSAAVRSLVTGGLALEGGDESDSR